MLKIYKAHVAAMLLTGGLLGWMCGPTVAEVRIAGQVQAGGGPLASATVTLWAASAGAPKQLAQSKTGSDGRFQLGSDETPGSDVSLYLVAKGGQATVNKSSGDNPAIALLTVLGNKPPATVVINEMTTVASVWTNAQFLDGTAIKGHALGLQIAAGNVPNFVDLRTGGWGGRYCGSAQQWPVADDGQFRDAGRLARRLHHAGKGRCLQQSLYGSHCSERQSGHRYIGGSSVDCPQFLVPPRKALRSSGPILSGTERQKPATCSVRAVSQLGTQCVGAAT